MPPLKNFRNIITNVPNSPCILKNRPKVIFQKVLSGGKELLPHVFIEWTSKKHMIIWLCRLHIGLLNNNIGNRSMQVTSNPPSLLEY